MTDTTDQKKPWGDDFDEAKAWTLVQNLRGDKSTLQADLATARQALTEAETKATAGETEKDRADKAERALWTERALRKHPTVSDDFVDFLSGDTEEEILAKAERLSKVGQPKAPAEAPKPDADAKPDGEPKPDADAKPELPGKPKPDLTLTPGHGGYVAEPFDPAAIAAKARS